MPPPPEYINTLNSVYQIPNTNYQEESQYEKLRRNNSPKNDGHRRKNLLFILKVIALISFIVAVVAGAGIGIAVAIKNNLIDCKEGDSCDNSQDSSTLPTTAGDDNEIDPRSSTVTPGRFTPTITATPYPTGTPKTGSNHTPTTVRNNVSTASSTGRPGT